ncbi:unnamed protein product [Allacma fusca]|uniref:Uncharacterized protein n=1 Tax=Allacma fusca TaxID=39272 RepID=A0A8J2K2F7_9HEXA|nr:unnamed protein product [Allacma fusca]
MKGDKTWSRWIKQLCASKNQDILKHLLRLDKRTSVLLTFANIKPPPSSLLSGFPAFSMETEFYGGKDMKAMMMCSWRKPFSTFTPKPIFSKHEYDLPPWIPSLMLQKWGWNPHKSPLYSSSSESDFLPANMAPANTL